MGGREGNARELGTRDLELSECDDQDWLGGVPLVADGDQGVFGKVFLAIGAVTVVRADRCIGRGRGEDDAACATLSHTCVRPPRLD